MIESILTIIFGVRNTGSLIMENLALRQQLVVMKRTSKRPQLQPKDRLFWVLLSRLWCRWREVLIIVKPDTVVRWHRQGLRLFWRRKSRHGGRSPIKKEIRDLVRKMAKANPFWGAPRIHGELLKLGMEISERTVSSLMPPSIYCNTDSVQSNTDLVFSRVPSHFLKVPEIEGVFTYEIFKDDLLRLRLDALWKFRKFLQKALLVFNLPPLVLMTDKGVLPRAPKAVHHRLPHPSSLPTHSSQ